LLTARTWCNIAANLIRAPKTPNRFRTSVEERALMATKLKNRSVVIVGGGLTAALVARQLTAKGTDVLVLERGHDRRNGAESTIPKHRDELRWDIRGGLGQNWAVETYTARHNSKDEALPARRLGAFLPGEGLGGAASHWNGFLWRWSEYDPVLRTHLE